MRPLILGGAGFIGPHIARRLVAFGHEVSVFHRGHSRVKLPDGRKCWGAGIDTNIELASIKAVLSAVNRS